MTKVLPHNYLKYYKPKYNDVWIDLGACTGSFCKENLTTILKYNIHVHCVEPNPAAFLELKKWCLLHLPNNTTLYNVGVWSRKLNLEFNILTVDSESAFTPHIQSYTLAHGVVLEKIQLPVIPLDHLLNLINKKINFIKCDIEGAEIEVFKNCKKLKNIKNIAVAAYHSYPAEVYMQYLKDIIKYIRKAKKESIREFITSIVNPSNSETYVYLKPYFEYHEFSVEKESGYCVFNTLLYATNS